MVEKGEQRRAVPGGVVDALQRTGQQLQLDIVMTQFLSDGEQLGATAAQALHLVHGQDHPLVRDGRYLL